MVEHFYCKWDPSKLDDRRWFDGVVDQNFNREADFMREGVSRLGPEPDFTYAPGVQSRAEVAMSMNVSEGLSIDNVAVLKSMSAKLDEHKDRLMAMALESDDDIFSTTNANANIATSNTESSTDGKVSNIENSVVSGSNEADTVNTVNFEIEVVQMTETNSLQSSLRWDERLRMFF